MIWGFPAALTGIIVIAPLLFLHIRRNRRLDVYVSSILLWDFAVVHAESPLRRRLKQSLHLLLQILIISLLILAAANPMIPRSEPRRGRVILILDGSASMTAGTGKENRFNIAVNKAESAVRRLGGREMAVILAGAEPAVISGFTNSRRQLINALEAARPAACAADMEAGFALADQLAEGSEAEVLLISDGGFTAPEYNLSRPLTLLTVGENEANIGITAFNARRDPEIQGRHNIFSAVLNSSGLEQTRELSLTLNGGVIESREIVIPPGKEVQQVFVLDAEGGRAELKLSGTDPFPMDDRAGMVIRGSRPLRLLLVTDGNYYLETLLKVLPGIELSVLEQYPYGINFDLVIFDKPQPEPLPPGGYLFLGVPSSTIPVGMTTPVDFPGIKSWDSAHPLMSGIDPRSFTVYRAYRTETPAGAGEFTETVLRGDVPLVLAYDDEFTRAVYLTFPLEASDLPLRAAFPVLLTNIVKWLYPGFNPHPYDGRPGGVRITVSDPGIAGRLAEAGGAGVSRTLYRPDGTGQQLIPVEGQYSFFPEDTGFYSMRLGSREYTWAVNLLSAEESDLSRRFEAPVTGVGAGPAAGYDGAAPPLNYFNSWPWLLLFGGVLLAVERLLARKGLPGSGRKGKKELLFTASAAAMLIAAGFNPVLHLGRSALSVIYLLDTSLSISPGSREAALEWIEKSAANEDSIDTTALITFGAEALVAAGPAPALPELKIDSLPRGDETNPSAALRRAVSILPAQGDRRLILISDGNETSGDLHGLLSSMNNPGLSVYGLSSGREQAGPELLIRSLTGPDRTTAGELFALTLEIESTGSAKGEIFFYVDGEYYGEDSVGLNRGPNQFVYKLSLEEHGFHQIEAVVYSESDSWYENNSCQKVIFTEGEPPLLYLYGSRGPSESLLKILQSQGYSLDIRNASDFPSALQELFSFKAVILDDVSAFELTFTEMKLLKNAAAGGLGVLACGGDSSFGLGGYYKTPLEDLLPVDVDITSSMDLPDMAILMIIDKSGTMNEGAGKDDEGKNRLKIDLAKQAVLSAVEVLEPNQQAAILSFDAGWEWTLPFTGADEIESIRRQLFSLQPGGGTILYPALEEAYRVLSAHPAAVKHMLILSDGHTDERDFKSLSEKIRKSGITISTVAVGPHSDRTLMENIARWGEGRAYYAEEIQAVPAIFADESLKASKRLTVEETFFPVWFPVIRFCRG